MHRFALLLLFFLYGSCVLAAQEDGACFSFRQDNAPYKKKLWDGYEISLGPSANKDNVDNPCTGAIYNKAGRVVFRTSGFSVVFDADLTGEDFDGDGKPEVVFRTDTGGGNHCCWGYIVFSLSPKPHKLFEIAMEGAVDFEKDKEGKMVIWQRVSVPGGLFISMASRPFAEKVFRVQEGNLTDVTADYCGSKDPRLEVGTPTPEDLKKLANAGDQGQDDLEDLISTMESRTAQHVFCREYDKALMDLNLWPESKREIERKALENGLAQEYPEFVAKLRVAIKKSE